MKTAFKASFLKAIRKIEDNQLKADIGNAIRNVESAKAFVKSINLRSLKDTGNFTGFKLAVIVLD